MLVVIAINCLECLLILARVFFYRGAVLWNSLPPAKSVFLGLSLCHHLEICSLILIVFVLLLYLFIW